MKLSGVFAWARRWLRWIALPPPWWVALSLVATVCAIWLCIGPSPWAPAVAVLYQVGGAVLAVWQFVSLQRGLNPGWLTHEVRDWWAKRPRKPRPITANVNAEAGMKWSVGASVTASALGTVEEQLQEVQKRLGLMDAQVQQLQNDLKRQKEYLEERLERVHSAAQEFSKAAETRISKTITSAPLQTALGLWLILLGSSMQVWLALPAAT